ncbi:hypothetical protein GCM10023310_10790 [Paenibacillus vulneris]
MKIGRRLNGGLDFNAVAFGIDNDPDGKLASLEHRRGNAFILNHENSFRVTLMSTGDRFVKASNMARHSPQFRQCKGLYSYLMRIYIRFTKLIRDFYTGLNILC